MASGVPIAESRARATLFCGVLTLVVGACGVGPRARPTHSGGAGAHDATVVVGKGALAEGDVVLAAWLAYGAAKLNAYEHATLSPANDSADDYVLELAAREKQSAFWAEQRKKGAIAHTGLDRQVEVWRAGFLPELVLAVNAHPGWTVPATTVNGLRFEEFMKRFAGDYPSGAPVAVKPRSGKLVPDVPGDQFPSPATLPIEQASCAREIEARRRAWQQWERQTAKLGGAPVAAGSALELARELSAARGDPAYAKGITWVSSKVGHLARLEGFCAIERKDWRAAVAELERATVLTPAEAWPRLELALVLTTLGRHQDSLALVDRALRSATDPCVLGLGWRRRGFVLFEVGALEAARFAYETSLRYEPGSALARHELAQLDIAQRAAKKTARSEGLPPSAFAPPPSEVTTSTCSAPAH